MEVIQNMFVVLIRICFPLFLSGKLKHFKSFLLKTKTTANKGILWCKFIHSSFFFNVNWGSMFCSVVILKHLKTNDPIRSFCGGEKCVLLKARGGGGGGLQKMIEKHYINVMFTSKAKMLSRFMHLTALV